jgi:DNA mismatch repair protein MutL
MPIQVLDPDVAAKIAAGEVIERPASVVKELVENAIDAGATEIRVEIRGGGQREMRIVDNGSGIASDDVELAFQRHATSKLRDADDLFNVHTLGFRGEALPSIATVAQVACLTRTADAPTGVELRIAGGEIQSKTARGGSPGTTFVIKNLFYNTPARLKFLRSEATESAQISSVIEHYALAFPNIRWTLLVDGRLSVQTPGTGQLIDAIMELYGIDVARQLIAVDDQAGEGEQHTKVHGFVSQPSLHRAARSAMHLFVNRRWVRATGPLAYVIGEAYHNLLMKGRHPLAVLHIEIDPHAVDVNVHPNKAEVKFLHQPQVHALLGRAVRAALADHIGIGELSLGGSQAADTVQRRIELRQIGSSVRGRERDTAWAQPDLLPTLPSNDAWRAPAADPMSTPRTAADAPPWQREPNNDRSFVDRDAAVDNGHAVAHEPDEQRGDPVAVTVAAPTPAPTPPAAKAAPTRLPPLRVVGQVSETYIVAEAPDGLYLVDQHAAHERVVFERLMRAHGDEPLDQQQLLLPATIELPPAVATLLLGEADALRAWGFAIEDFGDGAVQVRAVPHGIKEQQIGSALLEIADHLHGQAGSTPQDWREQMLTTIACHSSVRAGQTLGHEEMRQLLQQLERCEFPRSCPHGRPTALLLSQAQLERQFGRRG